MPQRYRLWRRICHFMPIRDHLTCFLQRLGHEQLKIFAKTLLWRGEGRFEMREDSLRADSGNSFPNVSINKPQELLRG